MLETCLNDRDETREVRRLFSLHLFSPTNIPELRAMPLMASCITNSKTPVFLRRNTVDGLGSLRLAAHQQRFQSRDALDQGSPSRHCVVGLLFSCS